MQLIHNNYKISRKAVRSQERQSQYYRNQTTDKHTYFYFKNIYVTKNYTRSQTKR